MKIREASGNLVIELVDTTGFEDQFQIRTGGSSAMLIDSGGILHVGSLIVDPGDTVLTNLDVNCTLTVMEDGELTVAGNAQFKNELLGTSYCGSYPVEWTYALTGISWGNTIVPLAKAPGGGHVISPNAPSIMGFTAIVCAAAFTAGVRTMALTSGGKDYTTGDILTCPPQPGWGTDYLILTVDPIDEAGGNAVTGVTITSSGNGYGIESGIFAS
jgi:hypothetical protein